MMKLISKLLVLSLCVGCALGTPKGQSMLDLDVQSTPDLKEPKPNLRQEEHRELGMKNKMKKKKKKMMKKKMGKKTAVRCAGAYHPPNTRVQ